MILDEILASKQPELRRLRKRRRRLEARAGEAPAPRGLAAALGSGEEVAVIAEFKRRSPSAGDLAPDAEPGAVAAAYEAAGASALSVLTDGPYFGGELADLEAARSAVEIPVLRKDFLVDPVQLLEARAAGADGVLLIVRTLEEGQLAELLEAARELGMDALVEAHSEEEVERAVEAGAGVVGVNARDLDSFAVDLELSRRLLGMVPPGRVAVAESGIRGRDDVARMAAAGADAVLVGGWLMRRGPGAVEELCGVPRRGRGGSAAGGSRPPARGVEVKICGLTRLRDVDAAADAGADYMGLVLAESPRRVDPEHARELADAGRARGLEPVGVFVGLPADEVREAAERVGLRWVQLHGDEDPAACRALTEAGFRVWKALRPRSRRELWDRVARYGEAVDALLVEGYSPEAAGGTGTGFPHRWLRGPDGGRPAARIVLAGGLDPQSVGAAVREAGPDVVDVSSGVESAPGEKSARLIRAFVEAARRAGTAAADATPADGRTPDAAGEEEGDADGERRDPGEGGRGRD